MKHNQSAFIGLGSNLSNPRAQVEQAIQELTDLADSQLLRCSSLYRSAPMGPPGQPDYVNAVAELKTDLPPLALLDALQAIEQHHRRVRSEHWGPRTLDLDILLFGDQVINMPRLQVPHPHMHERNFVLLPLQEIAPALVIPGQQSIQQLLDRCEPAEIVRIRATSRRLPIA